MNKHLLLLPVALAVTLGGLALAQSAPEGIDLEAIRERAAEHADDAQALSTNVRQRAEALTEDAQTIQRSEEHTSELQSLMRISYAVFCLKTKTQTNPNNQ